MTFPPIAKRLLIVDDNADAGESLALLLRLDGHEVLTATSGEAALQKVATYRPDVMLLDLGMPRMSGYDLAERVRARPELRAAMLVAVSGHGLPRDRLRSRAAGFHAHLLKPVSPAEVAALVAAAPRTAQPPSAAD